MATKQEQVRAVTRRHPDLSNHALAKLAGVSVTTVAAVRESLQPSPERRELSGRRARGRKPFPRGEDAPETTVYRCYGKPYLGKASLLDVGCSLRLLQKTANPWWNEVWTIRLRHYPTVEAALAAVSRAVAEENPKYHKPQPLVSPFGGG